MPSQSPRIAILGGGLFPTQAYVPSLAALPSSIFTLAAVYSRSTKSAESLAAIAKEQLGGTDPDPILYADDLDQGLDDLLASNEIDAVVIALPITLQPEIVRRAWKAGKHVLSEKPVGKDVATAKALIKEYNETYKSKGLIWRVAENFECEPSFRKAGDVLRSNQLGPLTNFHWETVNRVEEEGNQWLNTAWRKAPDYQGGFVLDGGVHTPAALRQILPSPVASVVARTSLVLPYLAPVDTLVSTLELASGVLGSLRKSWAAPRGKPLGDYFEAWCEKGYLTLGPADGGKTKLSVFEDGKSVVEEVFARSGVERELASFIGRVAGTGPQAWEREDEEVGKPEEVLKDLALIQAALESDGKTVKL